MEIHKENFAELRENVTELEFRALRHPARLSIRSEGYRLWNTECRLATCGLHGLRTDQNVFELAFGWLSVG